MLRGRRREPPLYEHCLCGKQASQNRSNDRAHIKRPHSYCGLCERIVLTKNHKHDQPKHSVIDQKLYIINGSVQAIPSPQQDDIPDPTSERMRSPETVRGITRKVFILWCMVEDDDDDYSPEQVSRMNVSRPYDPAKSPFCNITLDHDLITNQNTPWLTQLPKLSLEGLEERFREMSVRRRGGGATCVHQSLLTGLFASSYASRRTPSTIMTWKQVRKCLHTNYLHRHPQINLDPLNDELIMILADTSFGSKKAISSRYDDIENYLIVANAGLGIRTFVHPSREEAFADGRKLDDIRALDQVALELGTWRPTTCFGFGPCQIQGKDFKKRSWSSCSVHATDKDNIEGQLTCDRKGHPRRGPQGGSVQGHWFHQEYVEKLHMMEFRVYIIAVPDPSSIRGLRGRVIRVCCTERNVDGEWRATEATNSVYESHSLLECEVSSFALDVYEALRAGPYARNFESLNVGCRLDISFKDPGSLLFVNEVTRWCNADYFSDDCTAEPHTLICDAYAKACVQYVETQYKI